MSEAGHKFLAKLGKKRLRPGGKRATDWLIEEGGFSKEKRILEVACNRGLQQLSWHSVLVVR